VDQKEGRVRKKEGRKVRKERGARGKGRDVRDRTIVSSTMRGGRGGMNQNKLAVYNNFLLPDNEDSHINSPNHPTSPPPPPPLPH
jgi:hypothetical protein